MKLAYLLNTYPLISTTFIRREIEAVERQGQPVVRFASRQWDEQLVDPLDIAEQGRTEYLLTGNVAGLLVGGLIKPWRNPFRFWRAARVAWKTWRAADEGVVRHVNYLLQAIQFRQRTRALDIDHVHAHFSTNAATVAMLTHALGGPSYSFTVHGPDELIDPAKNAMGLKVQRAKFVAAITGYCRERIVREAPDCGDKVRIIPCGLHLPDFVPSPEPTGVARDIVCVGRICANKGQILIPQAVAALRHEFPDIKIRLVGDGDHRALLESEMRKYGVTDQVEILGWGDADQVRSRIRTSAALLLPSYAEGLPIVLMEALALERPVLTTIIAGIPELVDDGCGWIFPAGSIEQLTDALRGLMATTATQRAAMGREGRARIETRHDIDKSAALLIAGFRE